MRYLAPIVEGQGEVLALPALLVRIAQNEDPASVLQINPPIRVKSGSFIKDEGYFYRYVALASEKARQRAGSVLILLDCDDDCPATLGPSLLDRARKVSPDVDIFVALAYREYETWLISGVQGLRGRHGLSQTLDPPPDTTGLRDAKGWLGQRMTNSYDPIIHQLEFTRRFNLDGARANPSFNRLYRFVADYMKS